MALNVTIYPTTISWGGTWNSTSGGTLRLDASLSSRDIQDRTGNDFYPRAVLNVDGSLVVRVLLREVKWTTALGTKNDLSATLSTKSGSVAIAFPGMVLVSAEMSQPRGDVGSCLITLVHESSDGTTLPVT